jgi:hypothetical protein
VENAMLSEEKTLEILNRYGKKYSRGEAKIIKEFIERLCQIEYEILCERSKAQNSDHLYTGVDR